MHRFGLTPQEAARVESAVTGGRRMDDERLRRAAVLRAQQLVEPTEARRWTPARVATAVIARVAGLLDGRFGHVAESSLRCPSTWPMSRRRGVWEQLR